MKTQYDYMYNMLAGDKLESWGLDMLVYADSHADNAYLAPPMPN